MATTVETFGAINFYAITGAEGIDRPTDVIWAPWNVALLGAGVSGHSFLNFHKYQETIVRDGDSIVSNDVVDLENYYIGFHATGTSYVDGCTGHTQDNHRFLTAIQSGARTSRDYEAGTFFAANEGQWNAAKDRAHVWNARNYYRLIDYDCTSYAFDVALQLGLQLPVRSRMYNSLPYQAIRALIALNSTYYRGPMETRAAD